MGLGPCVQLQVDFLLWCQPSPFPQPIQSLRCLYSLYDSVGGNTKGMVPQSPLCWQQCRDSVHVPRAQPSRGSREWPATRSPAAPVRTREATAVWNRLRAHVRWCPFPQILSREAKRKICPAKQRTLFRGRGGVWIVACEFFNLSVNERKTDKGEGWIYLMKKAPRSETVMVS